LLGTTLAGKTTLMQLMAGLVPPTSGRVWFGGRDVTGVPVQKRNVAMVFQQFINYPNLSVFENIASPLRVARVPDADIRARRRRARGGRGRAAAPPPPFSRAPPSRAVGWPAAAPRSRAGPGQGRRPGAPRRAAGQPRLQAPGSPARGAAPTVRRPLRHGGLR